MRSLLFATAMCVAALTMTGCSFTVSGPCHSFCHQSCLTSCCGKSDCADVNCCPQAVEETGCGEAGCQDESCGECLDCSPKRSLRNWRLQPECSGVDMGEGAPCGMENVSARRSRKGLLGRLCGGKDKSDCGCESEDCGCESTMITTEVEVAPSISDCGCDTGACDGGCGETQARAGFGRGLFNRKAECASDCETGACEETQPRAGLFSRGTTCATDCDGSDCGGACGDTQTRAGLFSRKATCDTGCDGTDCGGACEGTQTPTWKGFFSRGTKTASFSDGCDDGSCDGTQTRTWKGLFSRGTETASCGAGCDGGACGGACGGSGASTQGGMFGGRGMGQGPLARHHAQMGGGAYGAAAPAKSCGRFGCGRGGKLCLTCKARHGLGLGHGGRHGNCGNGTCGRCKLCKNGMPYAGRVPHTEPTPGMTGQAPQYAYPYYTTRGPRDFLQDACAPGPILPYNPKQTCLPSIGF